MKKALFFGVILGISSVLLLTLPPEQEEGFPSAARLSDRTEECLDCHRAITPGIVEDWLVSAHACTTPVESMNKAQLERKVSSPSVPGDLSEVAVGCYECHGLNPKNHQDSFDHFDVKINVVVSPRDCAVCHQEEKNQYSESKKANALVNLKNNPFFYALVETITGPKAVNESGIRQFEPTADTKDGTCYACHGTPVEVRGKRTIKTVLGEIEVPDLFHWPNQGVGRANPDGSLGACTSCHPRHSFSIETARKPGTCSQCHLEPDVPAWNVYMESKHGNIYLSQGKNWNWTNVPWIMGQDFQAPTCAACHNSLLTDREGEVFAERSHDFGARLWIRIFGLIYSHPQPQSGKTYTLVNQDGLSLPVTFKGKHATDGLLDGDQQSERFVEMKNVCLACHSSVWAENFFRRFHTMVQDADRMVMGATQLMVEAWQEELADQTNPFDEALEQQWIEQWLFYANSVRYAAAMMGPDYAAFKNGWWKMTKRLQEISESIRLKRLAKR
jgi:hydroxylamine dehydrogenase